MRWYAGFLALPLIAVVSSCLGPTEIRIDITSNACDKLTSVEVYVGGKSLPVGSSAATQGCVDKSSPDGTVGSLVIVPSGSNDENVHIDVVGSLVPGACTGPTASGQDCIVARRALSFSPHTPLDVPIFLDSACAGQCTDPGQTCVVIDGVPTCKSATCDDDGGVSCHADGGTSDAGIIDGPIISTDVVSDVPVSFACTNNADAGVPFLSWSVFNTTDKMVHEDKDAFVSPIGSNTETKYVLACGASLHVKDTQQLLAQQATGTLDTQTFTVAFTFRLSQDTGMLMDLEAPTTSLQHAGFLVETNKAIVDVVFHGITDTLVFQDTVALDLASPHTFVMQVKSTSTFGAWVDGHVAPIKSPASYRAASDTLVVGTVEWIDNIAFYP